MAKRTRKDPDWGEIGQMVGKKVESEKDDWKGTWKGRWKDDCGHHHDAGFVGRLIFIIAIWIALDQLGLLLQVSFWVKVLIVLGFTLMRF